MLGLSLGRGSVSVSPGHPCLSILVHRAHCPVPYPALCHLHPYRIHTRAGSPINCAETGLAKLCKSTHVQVQIFPGVSGATQLGQKDSIRFERKAWEGMSPQASKAPSSLHPFQSLAVAEQILFFFSPKNNTRFHFQHTLHGNRQSITSSEEKPTGSF